MEEGELNTKFQEFNFTPITFIACVRICAQKGIFDQPVLFQ